MGKSEASNTQYTYTHFLDKQFVGTVVKLNSKGDRLLVTAPQMSPYDPTDSTINPTGNNIGTAYVIDHDPTNNSWSTNSYISSKYLLGNPQQYLGNCATLSGDGNVFAIGSPCGSGHAGFLNIYNYNTEIDIRSVCAFSTNGKTVMAGGNGTNNVFVYSKDGGLNWNNCDNDVQGGFYNGKVSNIYNSLTISLQNVIECPNNNNNDLLSTFGGQYNAYYTIALANQSNWSKFVTPDSIALNSMATIMAIGSSKYNHSNGTTTNNYGIIYMYKKDYTSTNWSLVNSIRNPSSYELIDREFKNSFGYVVKLNSTGSIMVTSCPSWTITTNMNVGAIYLYAANSSYTNWSHLQTIENPYYIPINTKPYNVFGISIAINNTGSVVVVGGLHTPDNTGIVYTYISNNDINKWSMSQRIKAPKDNDALKNMYFNYPSYVGNNSDETDNVNGFKDYYFGNALALNNKGDILAISSMDCVRIFYRNNNKWEYQVDSSGGFWGPNQNYGLHRFFNIFSISMNLAGTILAIGGTLINNTNSGLAFSNYNPTGHNNTVKGGGVYIYDISNIKVGIKQLQYFFNGFNAFASQLNAEVINAYGIKVSLNGIGNTLVVSNTNNQYSHAQAYSDSFEVICSDDRWLTVLSKQSNLDVGLFDTNFGSCLVISGGGQTIACGAPGAGVGGRVYTYDFNNTLNSLQGRRCNAIASNMNIWVAGGGDASFNNNVNPFSYSHDGMNWIAIPSAGLNNFITCNVIKWNGGKFVAGGVGINPLAYSYDGINWFNSTFSIMDKIYDLTWNGTYWIAAGQSNVIGTIAYSSDGVSWKIVNTDLPFDIISLASRSVISVNGSSGGGGSDQISLTTLNQSLGYNQNWKDVSSFKAAGVAYANETGRPIVINIYFNNPKPIDTHNENSIVGASGSNVNIFVGGIIMGCYGYIETTATFIVPPSVSYCFQGPFISWYEFS